MSRIQELTKLIRTEVKRLSEEYWKAVPIVLQNLKDGGIERNVHLGRHKDDFSDLQRLEWYGGQIIDVLESEQWVAVNSIINAVDKFAPEVLE